MQKHNPLWGALVPAAAAAGVEEPPFGGALEKLNGDISVEYGSYFQVANQEEWRKHNGALLLESYSVTAGVANHHHHHHRPHWIREQPVCGIQSYSLGKYAEKQAWNTKKALKCVASLFYSSRPPSVHSVVSPRKGLFFPPTCKTTRRQHRNSQWKQCELVSRAKHIPRGSGWRVERTEQEPTLRDNRPTSLV